MRLSAALLRSLVLLSFSACGPHRSEEPAAEVEEPAAAPEAYSLDGKPLYPAELSPEDRVRLEANLAEAQARFDENPDDPENVIWLGRRLGYLGRYRDAIEVYSRGIEKHPDYYKLYRHRGHRYISVRKFDEAIADLEKAASLIEGVPDEMEPDGAPNPAVIPRSTSHSNIWYHLGLAYYLKGDLDNAARAYEASMEFSRNNDDSSVASSDWLYMIYRRLGRNEDAAKVLEPIREEMDILENGSYHRRLLMYKGLLAPEDLLGDGTSDGIELATQGYGVGNWYFYNGEVARAKDIFERVVAGSAWSAFGFIAAEADLKRMGEGSS
ncbi:MAG: tetratricopeptide repeat protein [Vicinamibacteria bacterium]